MRFLTFDECTAWCAQHGFPICHGRGDEKDYPLPDIQSPPFHTVEFRHPADSGAKVFLARFLHSLLQESPELLVWVDDWSVWPSSQHMPLFTRFRQAFGEKRPLIEAPGQLVTADEADDAISILSMSLLFIWDCYVLSAYGRDAVFTSHDEYGWFASREGSVAEAARKQMAEVHINVIDTDAS